jgi:hypothetical protein
MRGKLRFRKWLVHKAFEKQSDSVAPMRLAKATLKDQRIQEDKAGQGGLRPVKAN